MNICLMYNKADKNAIKCANKIKEYEGELKEKYALKFVERISNRSKIDMYIIIADEIEEIIQYDIKIEEKEKIVIITGNCETSHILSCIEITNTISHADSSAQRILERVILKYYENQK